MGRETDEPQCLRFAPCAAQARCSLRPLTWNTSKMKIAFSRPTRRKLVAETMLKSYDMAHPAGGDERRRGPRRTCSPPPQEVPTSGRADPNLSWAITRSSCEDASSRREQPRRRNQEGAGTPASSSSRLDGILVHEPCAWRVVVEPGLGKQEVETWQVPAEGPEPGLRLGSAGTPIDDAIHSGILQGIKRASEFKMRLVRTGRFGRDDAQKAMHHMSSCAADRSA